MTILNLTTFLRTCQTKLVYHKKDGYHIFTNGIVLYACKDDNPNLIKLMGKATFDSTDIPANELTFGRIIDSLKNKHRAYVVDHIEKSKITIAITNFDETKGIKATILNKNRKVIKKNGKKEYFLVTVPFKRKSLTCYFVQSLTHDEFILIMPIAKN